LRALLEITQLGKSREQALIQVTAEAMYLLKPFFPEACDEERARAVFHERITVGAWEFSRLLRTKPVEYRLQASHVVGTTTEARSLGDEHLEANNFIDAETGCKLRRTTEIVYDSSGSFGQCLCICFSGPSTHQRGRSRYQDWQDERARQAQEAPPSDDV
jgi:hypothetical protein